MLRALLGRLLAPHFHYCGEVVDGERCGPTFDCRGLLCRGRRESVCRECLHAGLREW